MSADRDCRFDGEIPGKLFPYEQALSPVLAAFIYLEEIL